MLIPWFFQIWQNQQLELELKTTLISKISESVIELVEPIFLSVINQDYDLLQSYNMDEHNEIMKKWRIESATIKYQLRAYFPNSDVSKLWGGLSNYSFASNVSKTIYFLLDYNNNLNSTDEELDQLNQAYQTLLNQMDFMIDKILNAKITSF